MVTRRLTAFLGILLAVICIGVVPAAAQQSLQLPTVITVGLGYVVVPADHVIVTLNIEGSSDSAQEAYASITRITDRIREELDAAQLDGLEISVSRANLWQQRSATRTSLTYRTSATMSIKLRDEADVGRVIDTAMRLGAASVQSVRFHASNLDEAAHEALTLAVEDAMAKADAIMKSTGTRMVTIRQVSDENRIQIYNPSDPVLMESTGGFEPPFQISVERGQILVQVEVTMHFEVASRQ